MKRRHLPTAAAAVAVLSLLLTACGGSDDDSNADDKIKGADSATPTSSPSGPAAGRPEIKLPDGAKNVFEDWETGDPEKDAVLADSAASVDSVDEAILRGSTDTEALDFYNSGNALMSSMEYIKGYLDKGHAWAGTTRYFDQHVSFRDDGAAVVIYCSDESDSYITNADTGKPIEDSSGGASAYVLYNTRLEKDTESVWRTVNVVSTRGAKQCEE